MSVAICRYADAREFQVRAEPWLLRAEAEHNLVIGLARRLTAGALRPDPPLYLATVEVAGEVVGCAWRTPPHKLGLTRVPADALPALVHDVADVYAALPGVLGPEEEATRFGALWVAAHGGRARVGMRQRIFELDRLDPPPSAPPGALRVAQVADLELVVRWIGAFSADTGVQSIGTREHAEQRVRDGRIVLWDDGQSRAMAARVADTPNGARLGLVYTPPEWRGRGFASACVAALSRRLLDEGLRRCFLYTDLANPTSNRI